MNAPHLSEPPAQPGIEPKPSLRRRADLAVRGSLPWIALLLAEFFLSAPSGLPGESEMLFGVATGTVYYWSANRPDSMPVWAVFLAGTFADLVSFGPPGTVLLSLLVVHGVAHNWRYGLSKINFLLGWGLLASLALILSFFQWVVACIEALQLLSPLDALFQAALTIGIYPSLSAAFAWAREAIVNPERA
jgi:rod shape-determining protein MreD